MPIQVMYENDAVDAVDPSLLEELITSRKIKKFLRSEGWVTVGIDPTRRTVRGYHGPERRRTSVKVAGEDQIDKTASYTLDIAECRSEDTGAKKKDLPGFGQQRLVELQAKALEYRNARELITRLAALVESSSDAIIAKDINGIITSWNRGAEKIYGYAEDEVLGRNISMLFPPNHLEEVRQILEKIRHGEPLKDYETVRLRKDGQQIYMSLTISPIEDSSGKIIGSSTIARDITQRKRLEEELRFNNAVLLMQLETSPDGILVVDDEDKMIFFNQRFVDMWNISPDVAGSRSAAKALQSVQPILADPEGFFTRINYLYDHKYEKSQEEISLKDGRTLDRYSAPMFGPKGLYYGRVWYYRDITERRQMEEIIRRQAFYDPLTDLPNRRLFIEHLTLEMAEANRNNRKLAVMFLDLDNFKTINNTFGHDIGDALLRRVAQSIKSCIRESDRAGRLGGDEFNILLCNITYPEQTVISARKIMETINQPCRINGHELPVSTSIGISIYPDDGRHAEDLIKNADLAMFHAKEKGGNTFQFYATAMNARIRERALLEEPLRLAIERGELEIRYQPQVGMANNRITGVEALVRWQHPTLGLLPPARFLPLAEEVGFIPSIDSWMLQAACVQNSSWQLSGLPQIRVSVNLSARLFQHPDLVDMVAQVLTDTGLHPRSLDLELTENTVMHDIEASILKLTRLAALGVNFSIDDFGTGCTSLDWFRKLPIDRLKIDPSFIRGAEEDSDNRAIINAMISLAHNLNLKVVAEGVQTEGEAALLRSLGCDEMQGHLFSRALPADEFRRLISHTGIQPT